MANCRRVDADTERKKSTGQVNKNHSSLLHRLIFLLFCYILVPGMDSVEYDNTALETVFVKIITGYSKTTIIANK